MAPSHLPGMAQAALCLAGQAPVSKLVSDSQSLRPLSPGARTASPRIKGVGGVEHALRACSTPPTPSGERRRREQAIVMGIRH